MNKVIVGDCIDEMKMLPEGSVDSVVTDPPYGLGFMGKGWDIHTPLDFERFTEAWATECLRVLKPGGHLLAFGGSRTWHRLAAGIEDAGFELRDSIAWLYGSGFPKSMDVSKAIDKAAGAVGAREWEGWGTALKPAHEPVLCARKPFSMVSLSSEVNRLHHLIGMLLWLSLSSARRAEALSMSKKAERDGAMCVSVLASAATATSRGRFAKTDTYKSPALGSTFSSIVSSWSAILGAFSRPTRTSITETRSSMIIASRILNSLLDPDTSRIIMPQCECLLDGRRSDVLSADESSSDAWVSSLRILSASVPETAIEGTALAVESVLVHIAASLSVVPEEEGSAASNATAKVDGNPNSAFEPIVVARKPLREKTVATNVLKYGTGALNIDATRIGSESRTNPAAGNKPGGASLNMSLAGMPSGVASTEAIGRWPANVALDESQAEVLDALTDAASRFFYVAKAPKSERPIVDGVAHPTVKPLDLMRWLIRLVTRPGSHVLDPFAGSGTTGEAALLEGMNVDLIELEATHIPLIIARVRKPIQPAMFGDWDNSMNTQTEDLA